MPGEQESDSEGSSMENLGDVTQFGLTGALAQMANLTFMAGAPGNLFNSSKTRIYLKVVLETHNIQTVYSVSCFNPLWVSVKVWMEFKAEK